MSHPSLEVRGLNFERIGRDNLPTLILSKIDLKIADQEFVSVVGPSGCGKTTLLRLCAGLLGTDDASVWIDGLPATAGNPSKAVVFQQDSLFPWRTVQDNIALGLERQRTSRRMRHKRAEELAELVGLSGYERHYPHELSGGMRQRANVARALAVDPGVLLMDEPFSALDAQTRELMQIELLRIWSTGRKTVMFVTHQIDEAVFLSDRVVVLSSKPGRVIADMAIEIPRPRSAADKLTPAFQEYVRRIWQEIEPMQAGGLKDETLPAGSEKS